MQRYSPRTVIIGQNKGGCMMKPALTPAHPYQPCRPFHPIGTDIPCRRNEPQTTFEAGKDLPPGPRAKSPAHRSSQAPGGKENTKGRTTLHRTALSIILSVRLKPTPGIQPLSFNSVVCVHQASFWSRGVGLACWVLALRTRLSVSGVICRKLAICTIGARSTISGFSLRRRS